MSLDECHIGGNVATNAGGGKAIKYGVTVRYVAGLEVITPGGEVMEVGGKLLKDATGYNLIGLLAGSEGTLGVFTRIVLRLLPVPRARTDLFCLFPAAADAIAAVPRLMTETGIVPASCEFMDREAYAAACRYLQEPEPPEDADAMLLVTLDGAEEAEVRRQARAVARLCEAAGATDLREAEDEAAAEAYWTIRRNIGKAFNAAAAFQGDEDLVVPPASIPRLVDRLRALAEQYGPAMPAYGHAADGNIHVHILPPADWTLQRWDAVLPRLLDDLYADLARLGGRISAEHGIGLKRKAHMPAVVSPVYLRSLRALKRALDPRGLLNPGKIFE
jgi:glycolate oxidase